MSETAPVTMWLAEAQAKISLAESGGSDDADGLIPVAHTLLTVVVKVLGIHSPILEYWCKECTTTLHPCKTRREVTAALLGETDDG